MKQRKKASEHVKFKFPKEINISGVKFDMIYNKNTDGARFMFPSKEKGYIEIGTKTIKSNPTDFLALIIHELKEIIHVLQFTRYERGDEWDSYEFHYSHREHSDLCARLADALTNFI